MERVKTMDPEKLTDARVPRRYREQIQGHQGQGPWHDCGRDFFQRLGKKGVLLAAIGKSGVGKTQLAANIIYNVVRHTGRSCLYTTARDFFLDLKACYRADGEPEREVIGEYCKPSFLVIDEYDKRSGSQWEDGMLEHVINRRYGMMKDTMLIANYSQPAFEEALGPANLSRLNEGGLMAVCDWPSFREAVCG
jgi:DNA replication protein DnaC